MCVNNGTTGGANNGTWQKLNTTGTGGNTWKRVGGCSQTVPPQSPQPTGPFDGTSMADGVYGFTTNPNNSEVYGRISFESDGTWQASGFPQLEVYGPASGRWLAPGRVSDDFEIWWSPSAGQYSEKIDSPFHFVSTPESVWSLIPPSWHIKVTDLDSGECGNTWFTVSHDIRIRSKSNPEQQILYVVKVGAQGWGFCAG